MLETRFKSCRDSFWGGVMIKKIISNLVFIFVCAIATQAVLAHDVSICLFNGPVDEAADPILAGFSMMVQQAAAPIIASASLVEKISQLHGQSAAMQAELIAQGKDPRQELLRLLEENAGLLEMFDFAKARPAKISAQQRKMLETIEMLAGSMMTKMTEGLADGSWIIFKAKRATNDLVVMIPVASIPEGMDVDDLEAMSEYFGMPLDNKRMFAQVEDIASIESNGRDALPRDIASFFIPDSGPWNIFLIGHGWLEGQDGGEGLIAQLSHKDFQGLLNFFDTQIITNAFFYKTCHSGGSNGVTFFVDHKNNTPCELSFPVVCLCSNNMPSLFNFKEFDPCLGDVSSDDIEERLYFVFETFKERTKMLFNLRPFYDALQVYQESHDQRDLALAAGAFVPPQDGDAVYKKVTHLPRLRPAGATAFEPFSVPIDSEVVVYVTPSTEDESLDVTDKNALLLSKHHVTTKLVVTSSADDKPLPLIASVMPWEAFHVLDSIETNRGLEVFLQEAFCSHPIRSTHDYSEIPYSQVFLIKELVVDRGGDDEASYENVLVFADACKQQIQILVPTDARTVYLATFKSNKAVAWTTLKGKQMEILVAETKKAIVLMSKKFKSRMATVPLAALRGYLDQEFANSKEYETFLMDLFKSW